MAKKRGRPPYQWALYKGDDLLDMGTAKEIAGRRGIKVESLWFLKRPARIKRVSESALALVRVDDEDNDF